MARQVTTPDDALFVKGAATIDEAATFLGVSKRTVQRLVHAGELGYTRGYTHGTKYKRIPRVELIRYLKSGYVPRRAS